MTISKPLITFMFIIQSFFPRSDSLSEVNIGHGWDSAHATFYGDMSGSETMRKEQKNLPVLPMFLKIAEYKAGIVPVLYRRVKCYKKDGMEFELKGNSYWLLVLVYNVGGDGQVVDVKIKGSRTKWIQMTRNWGQNWQTWEQLKGQRLSFRVTASDGKMVQCDNVAPTNWQLNQVYVGKNF